MTQFANDVDEHRSTGKEGTEVADIGQSSAMSKTNYQIISICWPGQSSLASETINGE